MTQENLFNTLTNLDYTDLSEIETDYLENKYTPTPSDAEAETFMKRTKTLYQDRFNAADNERLENLILEYGTSKATSGFYNGFKAALLMIRENTIRTQKAFKE